VGWDLEGQKAATMWRGVEAFMLILIQPDCTIGSFLCAPRIAAIRPVFRFVLAHPSLKYAIQFLLIDTRPLRH
jgi:hypothetical protein